MFLVGDISKVKNQVVLKAVRLYKLELSNLYSLTVHSGTSAKDSTNAQGNDMQMSRLEPYYLMLTVMIFIQSQIKPFQDWFTKKNLSTLYYI